MLRKKKEISKEEFALLSFKDIITPNKVMSKKDHILSSTNSTYFRYHLVKLIGVRPKLLSLLRRINRKQGVTIKIDFETISKEVFYGSLEKTNRNNVQKKRTDTEDEEDRENRNHQSKFVKALAGETSPLTKYTVTIRVVASGLVELNKKDRTVLTELKNAGILVDDLIGEQFLAHSSFFPSNKNHMKDNVEFPNTYEGMTNLYVPDYSSLKHNRGYLIGKTDNGGVFCPDFTERTNTVTNSNIIITGVSGMGKSYLFKKIKHNILLDGTNIISFDPHDEDKPTFIKHGGVCLPIPKRNIMQFRKFNLQAYIEAEIDALGVYSDEKERLLKVQELLKEKPNVLLNHLSFLKRWFYTYTGERDVKLANCFIYLAKLTYKKHGIDELSDLPASKWVTLDDLDQVAEDEILRLSNAHNGIIAGDVVLFHTQQVQEVRQLISSACRDGEDAQYFNSTVDIDFDNSKQLKLVINTKTVNSLDSNVRSAIYLNMFNFLIEMMMSDKKTKYCICMDECHYAIEKEEGSKNFAFREWSVLSMVGRKYELIPILATTNFSEFSTPVARQYTTRIVDNTSFFFFFYTQTNDLKAIKELMTSLTANEISKIENAPKRYCLAKVGNESFYINVTKQDGIMHDVFSQESGRA